jgi:hypothetical protein
MSRIVLFTCVFLALGARAHAAEDVEIKQSGDFRVRYLNDLNSTGLNDSPGQQADTTARLRYNISARKGETLQAYVTGIFASQFGAENSPDGSFTKTANQNLITVNRAWAWWKATNSLTFKVGRFGIEFADGAVFSENEWQNNPTSHEGLQIAWDLDVLKLNLYAVKTNEYRQGTSLTAGSAGPIVGAPSSDPERNFYMLTADLKNLPEALKTANIHLIQTTSDAVTDGTPAGSGVARGKDNWQHLGLTVGGDASHVLYKFTGAFQTGKLSTVTAGANPGNTDFTANMFDVMVGYSMPDTAGLKFSAGFHRDSGNSTGASKQKQYQTLYYDRHAYAGLMDVVRWGNLTYWNLNASVMPKDDLEFGLGLYMFTRTEKGAGSTTTFGERYSSLTGATAASDQGALGSEVDLYAEKTYEGSFKIGARLSAFLPGTYLKDGTPSRDKMMSEGMVQAQMMF